MIRFVCMFVTLLILSNSAYANEKFARPFANLSTALSSESTLDKTVIVDTPMTINTKTVTRRVIKIIPGGSINVAAGKTLIAPEIQAGEYAVFTGTGTVITKSSSIPEWWGAIGDGSTDDTSALQSWGAMGTSSTPKSARRTYLVSDQVVLRGKIEFQRQSKIVIDGLTFPFGTGVTIAERKHVIHIGSESALDNTYDGTVVSNLTIEDTTAKTTDDTIWRTYLYVKYVDDCSFNNLTLIGLRSRNLTIPKEALNFESCDRLNIDGLTYFDSMSYRLGLVVYCTNSTFNNIQAFDCYGRVLCIEASSDLRVRNVNVRRAIDDSVYQKGGQCFYVGVISSNIYIENISLDGQLDYVAGDDTTHNALIKFSDQCTNIQVRGLKIRGSAYYAVIVQGSHQLHIYDADILGVFHSAGIICWPHSTTAGFDGLRITNSQVINNGTSTGSAALHLIGYLSPTVTYVSSDIRLENSEFISSLTEYTTADTDIAGIYTDAYIGTLELINSKVQGRGRGIHCVETPKQLIIKGGSVSLLYVNGAAPRPLIQATKFSDYVSGDKHAVYIQGGILSVPTTFASSMVNISCDVGATAYISNSVISSVIHNCPTGAAPFVTTGNIISRKENNIDLLVTPRTILTDGNDL